MTTEILFRGGKLFIGDGTILSDHAILINDKKIKKIAPVAEFENYSGISVDLTGKTLLPGIADCHVHLVYSGGADPNTQMLKKSPAEITLTALQNAQLALHSGITSVRDCGGKDFLEFSVRDYINQGVFSGPNIKAAGRMICMTGGHGNRTGRIADGTEDVIRAVREQVHAGCDLVKIMATGGVMTPGVDPKDAHYTFEEMRAGVHEAQRFRRPTASHAHGTEGILNAVKAGITSVEHGIYMDQECLDEMLARGTYLVPTISAVKNIVLNADQGIPSFVVDKARTVEAQHLHAFQMFYKAGGKVAMGTDAGTPFNLHGANTQELRWMVSFGMSPCDALISATKHAHELMGYHDRGLLKETAYADFLIVQGDPTQDIEQVANPINHVAVLKDGKIIRSSLTELNQSSFFGKFST